MSALYFGRRTFLVHGKYWMLNSDILQRNKKRYLAYTHFRKKIFSANLPKDSRIILYVMPWLLSVNRPTLPGYIQEMKKPFRVFGMESDREFAKQEPFFRKVFHIQDDEPLWDPADDGPQIQGIYTIGSVGTISQTSHSDCDLWICIDKNDFRGKALQQLNEKINLLRDWLDTQIRIPVYFFLSDIADIRNCNFGALDYESSGSTQKNVLKEEFYRTSIRIAGKIPFWWVCYHNGAKMDYDRECALLSRGGAQEYLDLGDLQSVGPDEYFGASIWQFNKSLTHPLKSIIKMLQLKMFLESPNEELLCHKLRQAVLSGNDEEDFPDPSIFAMDSVLDYYHNKSPQYYEYMKKLFYLRFDVKLMSGKETLKEKMATPVFEKHLIPSGEVYILNHFDSWSLQQHIKMGKFMFKFLLDIYKDIVRIQEGKTGKVAPQDLTILGRKLSSSLVHKKGKVSVMHLSVDTVQQPTLTIVIDRKAWRISSSEDPSSSFVVSDNLVYALAYIVWNGIYDAAHIRMLPNQTQVTLQEIQNLCRKIREIFGSHNVTGVHFSNFLEEEKISKILFIFSFENLLVNAEINDFCVIYKNNWEELFALRFSSIEQMKAYFEEAGTVSDHTQVHYYLQRTNACYEKMIERAKSKVIWMLKTLPKVEKWPFF
jgi:adenylate cyclase, class 1